MIIVAIDIAMTCTEATHMAGLWLALLHEPVFWGIWDGLGLILSWRIIHLHSVLDECCEVLVFLRQFWWGWVGQSRKRAISRLPSAKLTVCYSKWPFMVDLLMKNRDFPQLCWFTRGYPLGRPRWTPGWWFQGLEGPQWQRSLIHNTHLK